MIPFHPIAAMFPMLDDEQRIEMDDDVRAKGVLQTIWFYEEKILDGRNRYRAALASGRASPEDDYDGLTAKGIPVARFDRVTQGDPVEWVYSLNYPRRHLNVSQRAMAAARYATLKRGRPSEWKRDRDDKSSNLSNSDEATQVDAAQRMHVSRSSVQTASRVLDRAAPEVVAEVEAGHIVVSAADELAKLPVSEQLAILRGADRRAFSRVAKERRAETQEAKRQRRDDRASSLAAKHRDLPSVRAGIIVADPAWRDEEVYSDETGMDRAADNHYPTMTLRQIMALEVGALAADDCILFLWCKTNNLVDAICCALRWGFVVLGVNAETGYLMPDKRGPRYVSEIAWDKQVIGNGRWVRDRHEHLLIFRKGRPVAPAPGTQLPSVWSERKADHSAKPEGVLDWIDQVWPDEVKIELNRRGAPRPGWVAWGNEVEEQNTQRGESGTARKASGGQRTSEEEMRDLQDGVQPAPRIHSQANASTGNGGNYAPLDSAPASGEVSRLSGGSGTAASISHSLHDAGDHADPDPHSLVGMSNCTVAATPEGSEPASAGDERGAGRGSEEKQAPPTRPADPQALSDAQRNDVIRVEYARTPFPGLEHVAQLTGLTPNAVKQRAKRMGLGDRARQIAASRRPSGHPDNREAAHV